MIKFKNRKRTSSEARDGDPSDLSRLMLDKTHIRLRLMIAIPVMTTLLVLGLGLVVIDLNTRELLEQPVGETVTSQRYKQLAQVTMQHTTIVVVIGGIIAMVSGLALAVAITAPIRSLAKGSASIASGDYTGTIPLSGEGELALLGNVFNTMIGTMNQYLLQTVSGGSLTIDEKGIVTSMSSDAEVILGISSQDHIGQPISKIIPLRPENQTFHETIRATLTDRSTFVGKEMTISTDNTKNIPVSLSTSFLKDHDNTLIGLIISFDDVAHLSKIQERMRSVDRLTTLSGLAAGIAHQVHTPLGIIRENAQNLTTGAEDSIQLANYSEIILSDVERVENVVKRLERFVQPSTSDWLKTPATPLLNEIVALARYETKNRNVSVIDDVDYDLPPISCQEENLIQAILNVVVNAMQAIEENKEQTEPGEIRIEARLREQSSRGKQQGRAEIIVTITDNGPGIHQEHINRIFNPSFTTKTTGAGFGLVITKQTIEAHSGAISVTSTPGNTVFTITLPTTADSGEENTEVHSDRA